MSGLKLTVPGFQREGIIVASRPALRHGMPETLMVISIILVMSFLLSWLFRWAGLPPVVAQVIVGIVIGTQPLREFLLDPASFSAIDILAVLGIIFLLYLAGLEIDLERVKRVTRDSALIACAATGFPFVLGFAVLTLMGYDLLAATIFGGALGVTAEATIVKVLMDMDVINTKLAAIFLAAGVIDDILEILLLTTIIVVLQGLTLELTRLPMQLMVFAIISFFLYVGAAKFLEHFQRRVRDLELFSFGILLAIGISSLSQFLGFGHLFGAIVGGFVFQAILRGIGAVRRDEMAKDTRLITLAFVAPFFFVSIGLSFDVGLFFANPSLIIIATVLAVVGSITGSLMVKPFSRLRLKELYLVGLGMSSKGSAELVIALLAKRYGLISSDIFSALVTMAIITTLTIPFVLEKEIRRSPSIMDLRGRD
ncbi:MAG: cation:proton antiporter [Nitrososphaerota archaeon]